MKRVLLLLAGGFEACEAVAFTDVMGFATVCGAEDIEVIPVGLRPELRCVCSLRVKPQLLLEEAEDTEFDAIAVPGSFEQAGFYNDAYSDAFVDIFRRFAAAGKPIAAVCTGALPVARSGVLPGRCATTCHRLEAK